MSEWDMDDDLTLANNQRLREVMTTQPKPPPTAEERAAVIQAMEEARESHVEWRDNVQNGIWKAEELSESGSVEYNHKWVENYDLVLRILRHDSAIQSTERLLRERVDELEEVINTFLEIYKTGHPIEEMDASRGLHQALKPKSEGEKR